MQLEMAVLAVYNLTSVAQMQQGATTLDRGQVQHMTSVMVSSINAHSCGATYNADYLIAT
jgi:Mn-containing catalase